MRRRADAKGTRIAGSVRTAADAEKPTRQELQAIPRARKTIGTRTTRGQQGWLLMQDARETRGLRRPQRTRGATMGEGNENERRSLGLIERIQMKI